MRKLFWVVSTCALMIISVKSYGEIEGPGLDWKGFVSLRLGQIVQGDKETVVGKDARSDHVWVQQMNVGLGLSSEFKQVPATGNLDIEISVNNDDSPSESDFGISRRLNFYPFIARADIEFRVIERENSTLQIDVGYFPYKYNSSVRNLGEYLFRSGTYPQYLVTEVDFPMARLLGLRVGGTNGGDVFKWDVLATTNVEWSAIGDLNLSAIASWKPFPVFELGVGGSWCSIISVDLSKTTPEARSTEYLAPKPGTNDTMVYNYTFAGQKVMARLLFDLKQLLPWKDKFGEEELKLYSEAAILGLINYPVSIDGYTRYDSLWQRIPVMVGLNIPTNRFLDVLSLEVEWYGNPYVNSINSIKFDNQPVPLSSHAKEKTKVYQNIHSDDIKWSIHARKVIANNFFIKAQFASDHIRWYRLDFTKMDGKEAFRNTFQKNGLPDHWYYTFKIGYTF